MSSLTCPQDIPDIKQWAATVQAVVTAIRGAGATKNIILMPGQQYTSAEVFVSSGSAAALATVKNPDGTTDNLIMDVHKYLDSDNSGTHTECVKNNIDNAFQPLATWLKENKRQAMLTETGGGNTASCQKYLCEQIQFLKYVVPSYYTPITADQYTVRIPTFISVTLVGLRVVLRLRMNLTRHLHKMVALGRTLRLSSRAS